MAIARKSSLVIQQSHLLGIEDLSFETAGSPKRAEQPVKHDQSNGTARHRASGILTAPWM